MEKEGVVSALGFLGLSKTESAIYLFICSNPETTAGAIIKTLRIARSKTYDALNKLISMGLVSRVSHGSVSRYFSSGSSMLRSTCSSKIREMEEALEYIGRVAATNPEQTKVQVLEGLDGYCMLKESFLETLNRGEELLIIGSPRRRPQQLDSYLERFHRERAVRGIMLRTIHTRDVDRRLFSKGARRKLSETRFLREGVSPAWIEIYGNNLIIPFFSQKVVSIAITDKDIAESFRIYFNTLWESYTLRKIKDGGPHAWEMFRNFFDFSPIPLLVVDAEGRFKQANAAWHGAWGLSQEDVSEYSILEDPIILENGLEKQVSECFKSRKRAVFNSVSHSPGARRAGHKVKKKHFVMTIYPELADRKDSDFFAVFQEVEKRDDGK